MEVESTNRHVGIRSRRAGKEYRTNSRGGIWRKQAAPAVRSSQKHACSPKLSERYLPASGRVSENPEGLMCQSLVNATVNDSSTYSSPAPWLYEAHEDHHRTSCPWGCALSCESSSSGDGSSLPGISQELPEADVELLGMGLYDDQPNRALATAGGHYAPRQNLLANRPSLTAFRNGFLLGEAFEPQSTSGDDLPNDAALFSQDDAFDTTLDERSQSAICFDYRHAITGPHPYESCPAWQMAAIAPRPPETMASARSVDDGNFSNIATAGTSYGICVLEPHAR